MSERCPICDRPECQRSALWLAYMDREDKRAPQTIAQGDAAMDAQGECERNRVDWRARCLKAESALASPAQVASEVSEEEVHAVVDLLFDAFLAGGDAWTDVARAAIKLGARLPRGSR